MKAFTSHDPEVLEKKWANPIGIVVGPILILVGMAWAAVSVVSAAPEINFMGLFIGFLLEIAGLLLASIRSGLTIDKRTGVLTRWEGFLLPIKKQEQGIGNYDTVTLRKEYRTRGKERIIVYRARLEDSEGEAPLVLSAIENYFKARREAKEIAGFLGLTLVDSSSGVAVTREAHELGEPLRERLKRTDEVPEHLEPPRDTRVRVEREEDELRIFTPAKGMGAGVYLILLPFVTAVLLLSWAFFPFISKEGAPLPIRIIIGLIVITSIILTIGIVLEKALKEREIIVSRDQLLERTRVLLISRSKSMSLSEMEELLFHSEISVPYEDRALAVERALFRLFAKPGLLARSDKAEIKFAEGLSDEELKYVHYEIMRMIAE